MLSLLALLVIFENQPLFIKLQQPLFHVSLYLQNQVKTYPTHPAKLIFDF